MGSRNKFSLKRFEKDREESYQRSKKGELNLINPSSLESAISSMRERYSKMSHPLYEKAECCEHKLALGCDLAKTRRNKPECEACL